VSIDPEGAEPVTDAIATASAQKHQLRERIPNRASQQSRSRKFLGRAWLPLVAVIAVALGALCMWKVHQASAPGPVLAVNGPQAPEEFVPKKLTYELDGTLGDGGILSYIDLDGHPHTVDIPSLPWSHSETTTLTVVSGSISAQVHGGDLHCRMLVDDVVRDEQSATRQDADVTCRVKSA
jgi:MmpS family membrane protein